MMIMIVEMIGDNQDNTHINKDDDNEDTNNDSLPENDESKGGSTSRGSIDAVTVIPKLAINIRS